MSKPLITLMFFALAGVYGCAGSLATADGERLRISSAAFADYAERVFRLQNEVLDELAFSLAERPDDIALLNAEEMLLEACADINEVAVRRQRGGGVRPLRDMEAAQSVPACESAAVMASEAVRSRGF
jgi:hypothetical protein